MSGANCENDWARECRRIIPLLRRATPSTAAAVGADAAAAATAARNGGLPAPTRTRTPRPPTPTPPSSSAKLGEDVLHEKDRVTKAKQPDVAVFARGGKWGMPKCPDELGGSRKNPPEDF